jgi:Reverse transcriptase (RNA-dependent DNA polymerase)
LQILETIIADHLREAISKDLNPRQHGNRKDFSSTSQLLCVHEELLLNTKLHGRVDCVRIDFTKAADMVVHSILIEKLWALNIDPILIKWIEAYLTDRLQSVKIVNAVSNPRKVTSGLPQGSPLSNVLLNIYLNDLYKIVDRHFDTDLHELVVYQYSDDTIFANKITCEDDCKHLQNALHAVEVWMEQHHMRIDNEKCNSMTFSLGKETFKSDFTYTLLGKPVKKLKSMKYLGIMISDNFSQKKQFYHAIDNVKKDFYIELCHALDSRPELKISCYEQYVRSRLESSCAVWNLPFLPKNLNKILEMEEIQNKIFLTQECGLRNLAERRLMFTLGTLAQVLNRKEPYLEMLKWLDLFNPSFKRSHFSMMLMNSDRSIIGNALKELVLLWFYFLHNGNSERATEIIASLMKNFNSNSTVLRKFCNMRFQKFASFCFDDDKVSLDLALLTVNKCLHPQLSLSQLEVKIKNSKVGRYYTAEPDDDDISVATSRPERLAERTESVGHRMTFENCVRTVAMFILSLLMCIFQVIRASANRRGNRRRRQQRQPYWHHRR